MKTKNIIVFSVVAVINSISAYLLYVFNYQKFQQNDFVKLVVLYLFSLFTYWFFFVFYTIEEKIKKTPISSPIAVICSVIAFIAIILNLKNDSFLFFPLMYIRLNVEFLDSFCKNSTFFICCPYQ